MARKLFIGLQPFQSTQTISNFRVFSLQVKFMSAVYVQSCCRTQSHNADCIKQQCHRIVFFFVENFFFMYWHHMEILKSSKRARLERKVFLKLNFPYSKFCCYRIFFQSRFFLTQHFPHVQFSPILQRCNARINVRRCFQYTDVPKYIFQPDQFLPASLAIVLNLDSETPVKKKQNWSTWTDYRLKLPSEFFDAHLSTPSPPPSSFCLAL